MSNDDLQTMYGSPLAELFAFLIDFVVFCTKSIYFFLETIFLTILPNRYRTLKVSREEEEECCESVTFGRRKTNMISAN